MGDMRCETYCAGTNSLMCSVETELPYLESEVCWTFLTEV